MQQRHPTTFSSETPDSLLPNENIDPDHKPIFSSSIDTTPPISIRNENKIPKPPSQPDTGSKINSFRAWRRGKSRRISKRANPKKQDSPSSTTPPLHNNAYSFAATNTDSSSHKSNDTKTSSSDNKESAFMDAVGFVIAGPLAWRACFYRNSLHPARLLHLCIDSFRPLASCPREFWIILLLKLLESFAYFSLALNFVLFLSDEFDTGDFDAGLVYGAWGILTSIFGLLTSFLMDRIGIRYAIVVGGCISLVGRLGLALAPSFGFAVFFACFPLAIGQSLAIPVMTVAVRRYSTEKNSALAFGLYYTVQNVGALLSGPFTDVLHGLFTSGVPDPSDKMVELTAIRLIFLIGALLSAIYSIVAFFTLRDIELVQGESGAPDSIRTYTSPAKKQDVVSTFKMLWLDPVFIRLLVLSSLLSFVNLIFRFLDAMFPKYLLRTIGDEAHYGTVYAINPLMIILLVPLLSAFTSKMNPYKCILVGSWISSLSVIYLCIAHNYSTAVLFVMQLSVGEALYSPRAYQYAMLLAQRGYEGVYSTFASLPMFGAKLLSGVLSGWLLESFCSENDGLVDPTSRNCADMWLIVLCIVIVSPVFLSCFQRWIVDDSVRRRIQENGGNVDLYGSSGTFFNDRNPTTHGSIPLHDLAPEIGTERGNSQNSINKMEKNDAGEHESQDMTAEYSYAEEEEEEQRVDEEDQQLAKQKKMQKESRASDQGKFVIEDFELSGRAGNL